MKIIALLILTLTTPLLAARSPAVEPVTGISIEEYTETKPSPSSGFDFTKTDESYAKAPSDTGLSLTSAIFLFLASSLPFVVWFGVMRALPDALPQQAQASKPVFSVIEGDGQSKTDDHGDHDDTYPKAS
tara:strand:- start:2959 stop:3348 length:390 start_codon:yes stop_codon:yes gene_type:complete